VGSPRIGVLLASARGDGGWQGARDGLVAWCRTVLVPHTEAEAAVLYPSARRSRELEPLVRALAHEQALLGDIIVRLQSASDGPTALMHAAAAQMLVETHVAKEDDLLLPAMAAAPGTPSRSCTSVCRRCSAPPTGAPLW
jgi:hypothetical protein